ncbi:hypothetical protein FEE95_21855 [Maribacter algarum]|uniref:Dienelactone hydrolase domain-containing protein n=1 Tax=Maribacter algarum (ex Zhang et al. 2020) TaxID=2578118 RepID=A0A5S3PCD5_9FLAO|nr:hypothetical protein [Maribacter algarum]TMM51446.1 hypothetical protein FEE95_21855 [Maribacter algarum]
MEKFILLFFVCFGLIGCKSTSRTAKLKQVDTRGWYTTLEPFAKFNPSHKSVEIWTPEDENKVPLVIYAHGGAGFREDDRRRVEMLRNNGYATISFDAYEMNDLDWNFVTRKVTNTGKQNLIWEVFKGAVAYATQNGNWDRRNIFFYGASNGGRTVLYAGNELINKNVRGIISEAPAATGYSLGELKIPTIILFGKMDNWAGKSDTDFVWTRTYPTSPISIESWLNSQRSKGHPIQFIFYENAGHLLFEGPLEKVTVRRGENIAFTAYQGADELVPQKYEQDVTSFIKMNSVQH